MKLSKNKGVVIAALIAISFISWFSSNLTHKWLSYSEKQVWTEHLVVSRKFWTDIVRILKRIILHI